MQNSHNKICLKVAIFDGYYEPTADLTTEEYMNLFEKFLVIEFLIKTLTFGHLYVNELFITDIVPSKSGNMLINKDRK